MVTKKSILWSVPKVIKEPSATKKNILVIDAISKSGNNERVAKEAQLKAFYDEAKKEMDRVRGLKVVSFNEKEVIDDLRKSDRWKNNKYVNPIKK
jgi:hypothetical protein